MILLSVSGPNPEAPCDKDWHKIHNLCIVRDLNPKGKAPRIIADAFSVTEPTATPFSD
jgi:hypothetical protein